MNLQAMIRSANEQDLHILNIVVRQAGEITCEHHFSEEQRVLLWSVSKTFTSMAVGIAEGEGVFKTTDCLSDHFRTPKNALWDRLTVHDLLCMGTGQTKCPVDEALEAKQPLDDIEKLFFYEPILYEPGTHFLYSNAATYMLSKLISIRTGHCMSDYLRPRLFEPLGIRDVYWEKDRNGIDFGCSGLHLSAHEVSKFGQLLLDNGEWEHTCLIPPGYIQRATSQQIDNSDFSKPFATADHWSGYGYQVWMNSHPGSYRMDGLYGQYVVVIPAKKAVITFISNEPRNMTGILELTWKYLVEQL